MQPLLQKRNRSAAAGIERHTDGSCHQNTETLVFTEQVGKGICRNISLKQALNVQSFALTIPDTDSYNGLLHTLFALEDTYGFNVNTLDGELCLSLEKYDNPSFITLFAMLSAWRTQAEKLKNGEITKAEYDEWRYNYPKSAAT